MGTIVAADHGVLRAILGAIVLVAVCGVTATAWACPSCPVALTAREQVLAPGFAQYLAIMLGPFILIGAVCVAVESLDGRSK